MKLEVALNQTIQSHKLLDSKFYQAWSRGELPISALQAYASDYGNFITLLPKGWESQGDEETAHEEVEHVELWQDFAASIGTKLGDSKNSAVQNLMQVAGRLFSHPITALGALYAFESQQPDTSVSKLEGLRKHYTVNKAGERYFEVHSCNHHESVKLLERISKLSEPEKNLAIKACGEMAVALRGALDGLYEATCPGMC